MFLTLTVLRKAICTHLTRVIRFRIDSTYWLRIHGYITVHVNLNVDVLVQMYVCAKYHGCRLQKNWRI